jgi:hypothetical protein
MTLQVSIYNRLATDATLTAQLGTPTPGIAQNILYTRSPGKAMLPLITYWILEGSPNQYQAPAIPGSGQSYLEMPQVQLNTWAESWQVADSIQKRIGALLDFVPPATFTIDDATLTKLERTSPLDWITLDSDPDEGVNDVWHGIITYNCWLQRQL